MPQKAGKTLSILKRIDRTVGAIASKEELAFTGAHATITTGPKPKATVTFKNGRVKEYFGSFAVRGLADISERVNIEITVL